MTRVSLDAVEMPVDIGLLYFSEHKKRKVEAHTAFGRDNIQYIDIYE